MIEEVILVLPIGGHNEKKMTHDVYSKDCIKTNKHSNPPLYILGISNVEYCPYEYIVALQLQMVSSS